MDKSLLLLLVPLLWFLLIVGILMLHVLKRRRLTIGLKGFGIELHVKSRCDGDQKGEVDGN